MPTRFRPNMLENAHPIIVPGTPVITGKPETTVVAGSEDAPGRPETPVTWDATVASMSAAVVAAGARVGDGVGATGVAGAVVEEDSCW